MRDRCRRLLTAIGVVALTMGPRLSHAQAGVGHLEDASIAPRGLFRLRAITVWTRYDARFTPTGVQPLGAPFTSDALGRAQVASLGPIDSLVESATGSPFTLSLGRSRLDARAREEIVPIGVEYGLTNRFSIGVVLPMVRQRRAVQFRLDSAGANIGPNLQRTSPAAQQTNSLVQTEFAYAAAQLQGRLQLCQANPGSAGCPALLARQSEAQQLLTASQGFASALASLYGGGTSTGMAFVPIAQGATHTEVALRVADFNARYRDLLASSSNLIQAVPAGAGGPAGTAAFQRFLTDEAGGDSLVAEERSGLGDVELNIKTLLVDRPVTEQRRVGTQLSLQAALRFPTRSEHAPTEMVDQRLGAPMVDARTAFDLQAGRVGVLAIGELTYTPDGTELARDSRWIGVHLAPRWHFSDPLSFHAAYSLRSADYTGARQFVGGGVSFSTLPAFRRRGGPLPLEMRFTHLETISAAAGQPKFFRDQIEVRLYYQAIKR